MPSARCYKVAYSGGLDSHVLLHALVAQQNRLPAPLTGAMHIHHGLHPQANQWANHCRNICHALNIPYQVQYVNAHPQHHESPEEGARRARYQAFVEWLQADECLLTAHHQDDQAETLLLRLLRGSGIRGLAGIRPFTPLGKGWLARPLLGFSRKSLQAYGQWHQLQWIEDSSNQSLIFDRNYLRHQVIPLLEQRWPGLRTTLSRVVQHAQKTDESLKESTLAMLTTLCPLASHQLSIPLFHAYSTTLQSHIILYWLTQLGLPSPASHIIEAILAITRARQDATPCITWPGGEVRRYRDWLHAMPPLPTHRPNQIIPWHFGEAIALHGLGKLTGTWQPGQGLRSDLQGNWSIRFRQGGECCQPTGTIFHKTLKNLLQERGIPPWQRDRIPLLYFDQSLVAVADHWLCHPFTVTAKDQIGWIPHWENETSL